MTYITRWEPFRELNIELAKRAKAKPKQIKVEVGKSHPTLEAKKEKAAA